MIDIRFGFFVEVDDFGIAAAFEIEDAVIVPAMFVIANEQALRIGGKGGFASSGKSEEDGRILTLLVRVGGAVHGSDAF